MSVVNQLKGVLAMVWFFGIIPIRRSPADVLNFVVSPLTILFFIYLFAGPEKARFAISGGLTAVIVASCIILQSDAGFIRLVVRLQDMFVASPLSPLTYVVGLAIGELFNGLPGIILFSILLATSGSATGIGALEIALASTLTWASVSSLGFLLSTFARDMRDLWVYTPLLTVALSFLPPVFYPITLIPPEIRFLAYASPTTYPAQIIQMASGLIPYSSVDLLFDFLGGLTYVVILIFFSARLARWRQR
jgi:ABC-2 type transport system permease protein